MATGDKIILATQESVDNIVTTATGTILTFSSASVPSGFLECNGDAINRTTYSDLFVIIADTYGVGDGSTTFNLPDLRGEFIRGFDNGKGTDSGRAIASTQTDENQPHTHSTPAHAHTGSSNSTGAHTHTIYADGSSASLEIGHISSGHTSGSTYVKTSSSNGAHSHTITVNSGGASTSGSSGTTETRPRNIAMMFCIKT